MNLNPNTIYLIRFGSSGGCLAALVNRDGSTPFPIRTKSCESADDPTILWLFTPDGQGRYFVYNKAWPGKSNRLDLVLQVTTSLYIPWMGPSDDIYNNQRWFVSDSGQISSFGLPGALLTVTEIQGQSSLGALLLNETQIANDAGAWQVLDASDSKLEPKQSTSSPSPESPKSASPKTDTQPAPNPQPTTFLTSRLTNSEQNILATDQAETSMQASHTNSLSNSLGGGITSSTTVGAQPTGTVDGSGTGHSTSNAPMGLSQGAIAGIVVGAIILVLIIGTVGLCWGKILGAWKTWKDRKHEDTTLPGTTLPGTTQKIEKLAETVRRFSLRHKAESAPRSEGPGALGAVGEEQSG